jgi:hypothetical protein
MIEMNEITSIIFAIWNALFCKDNILPPITAAGMILMILPALTLSIYPLTSFIIFLIGLAIFLYGVRIAVIKINGNKG